MTLGAFDEFAERLVRLVRDRAIESCDQRRNPETKGRPAAYWKSAIENGSVQQLLDIVIPDCVDIAIFYILDAIDNEGIQLTYKSEEGVSVNLCESQEMAGWYISYDWVKKYSAERFVDYFDDLP
jgi:hypothetical protein